MDGVIGSDQQERGRDGGKADGAGVGGGRDEGEGLHSRMGLAGGGASPSSDEMLLDTATRMRYWRV